jgi:steroid delta-isomerase-like uncharacterized protein
MSVEQAGTVVRRYFEQINDRNVAVLDELLSPNYVDHTPLPFPVPAGRDGTSQVAHAALRATPDGWHQVRGQVADADLVMTLIHAGGTFQEALYNLQPTGGPISMSGIALHRVSEGRLVEHWGISDFAGLFQQIGLLPGPAQHAPAPPPAPPARSGRAPSREEAAQLMQRFVQVLNESDLAIADEILAPDFYANFIGVPPMTDRESWKQFVMGFLAAFTEFHLGVEHTLYDGEWSGAHWSWTARHTGEFMGIPATDRRVQVQGMGLYRILDGRIVEENVIEDMMAILVQLGVAPAPPAAVPI